MSAAAQQTSKVSLDSSETIFAVLAAINGCDSAQETTVSDPIRAQVQSDIASAIAASKNATSAQRDVCVFHRDHQQADPGRDLAQYISLALKLGPPPNFAPTVAEADLPPDASYVLGMVPLLRRFYEAAGLHQIWEKNSPAYHALIERWHQPVADMLLRTDAYLKLPLSGYSGRKAVIYVQPLAPPGQVNARNYGSDYYLVISPEQGALSLQPIRHMYLHFVLDALAMKRGSTLNRLKPLLQTVRFAPMDSSFKEDISLLVTESLIRAIESRISVDGRAIATGGKPAEVAAATAIQNAAEEGFVLAPYFARCLVQFEKDKEGLEAAYPNWLYAIDVNREMKFARQVHFAREAAPEILRASKLRQEQLLDNAENSLMAGNLAAAQQLAQQALREDPSGNAGRAFFVLAQVAALSKNTSGAIEYFQRTLQVAREPRLIAWSHIYLGRIFDINSDRQAALQHYRAALAAGDTSAVARTAAERGLEQPYQLPHQPTERQSQAR